MVLEIAASHAPLKEREGHRMRIVVIDGQGGGIGSGLIEQLKQAAIPGAEIIAVGTNVMATSSMLRAGAGAGATGENAVIFNSARADVIVGPMGIVLANSMMGEISPAMAAAVSGCEAKKILIPIAKCHVQVVGVENRSVQSYLADAVQEVKRYLLPGAE
jgi:hypothetical protein